MHQKLINYIFRSSSLNKKKEKMLLKKYVIHECRVDLKDVMKNKTIKFNGYTAILPAEPKKRYTCYECWTRFVYTHELARHKLIHKKQAEEKQLKEKQAHKKEEIKTDKTSKKVPSTEAGFAYRCEVCNVDFETIESVRRHATSKCKFFCEKCKRTYNTMHAFNVHILQHKINSVKPKDDKKHTCELCSKEFLDLIQLKGHMLLKHSKKQEESTTLPTQKESIQEIDGDNDSNSFTCELCYDMFNNAKELQEHVDFHKQLASGDGKVKKEVPIDLPVIQSTYSLSEPDHNLNASGNVNPEFEIISANDKIPKEHYKCVKCLRIFITTSEYKDHLKGKCSIINTCPVCSRNCKSNARFFSHFSKSHSKTFICEYCFEIVRTPKDVDVHKLSHFKSFKHVCKICFKLFKTHSTFNKHLKDHLPH